MSIPLDLVEKLAEALSMLGLRRALVVHGLDGLDEITITGKTRIAEAREGIGAFLRNRAGGIRDEARVSCRKSPAETPRKMPTLFARC